jgi:hypothetical protein
MQLIAYLRGIGAVSIILSLVSLLMLGPDAFPYCAGFMYLAVLIFTADVLLETRDSGPLSRALVVTTGAVLVGLISWRFVFLKLPLL